MIAYCPKCRKKRQTRDEYIVRLPNQKILYAGTCTKCRTMIYTSSNSTIAEPTNTKKIKSYNSLARIDRKERLNAKTLIR